MAAATLAPFLCWKEPQARDTWHLSPFPPGLGHVPTGNRASEVKECPAGQSPDPAGADEAWTQRLSIGFSLSTSPTLSHTSHCLFPGHFHYKFQAPNVRSLTG